MGRRRVGQSGDSGSADDHTEQLDQGTAGDLLVWVAAEYLAGCFRHLILFWFSLWHSQFWSKILNHSPRTVQIQIETINKQLRTGDLGIPEDIEARFDHFWYFSLLANLDNLILNSLPFNRRFNLSMLSRPSLCSWSRLNLKLWPLRWAHRRFRSMYEAQLAKGNSLKHPNGVRNDRPVHTCRICRSKFVAQVADRRRVWNGAAKCREISRTELMSVIFCSATLAWFRLIIEHSLSDDACAGAINRSSPLVAEFSSFRLVGAPLRTAARFSR